MMTIIFKIIESRVLRNLVLRLLNKYSVGGAVVLASILGVDNQQLQQILEGGVAAWLMITK